MVLDRLLLWLFSITCLVGTVSILCQAPTLSDTRPAIDDQFRGKTAAEMHELAANGPASY